MYDELAYMVEYDDLDKRLQLWIKENFTTCFTEDYVVDADSGEQVIKDKSKRSDLCLKPQNQINLNGEVRCSWYVWENGQLSTMIIIGWGWGRFYSYWPLSNRVLFRWTAKTEADAHTMSHLQLDTNLRASEQQQWFERDRCVTRMWCYLIQMGWRWCTGMWCLWIR